jgi:hypothetical protein
MSLAMARTVAAGKVARTRPLGVFRIHLHQIPLIEGPWVDGIVRGYDETPIIFNQVAERKTDILIKAQVRTCLVLQLPLEVLEDILFLALEYSAHSSGHFQLL